LVPAETAPATDIFPVPAIKTEATFFSGFKQ